MAYLGAVLGGVLGLWLLHLMEERSYRREMRRLDRLWEDSAAGRAEALERFKEFLENEEPS